MRAVLDTCVIYPTVMREMLLGVAATGAFTPLWSQRIIGEWLRAAVKLGPAGVAQAEGEAVMLKARFPKAEVTYPPSLEERLWLPDAADTHVLAAAVAGSADVIVTLNARDFPRNILAEEGVSRADPDHFLLGFWQGNEEAVEAVARDVLAEARRLSGEDWTLRALLKKARLPRLAKALSARVD
ncbi:RSP_2648 family PIN domain-containing protein [Rhodalgimonas zhirmunskyi]|uniref:PIN domain-containing protein n=1 Tax=Rhodalgimonas zhirmunskyi TaxID=2964767 RepID=A0AAJ1UBL7_9RHOB|nr:PIN domain-containing protein [Rhodoalgimonas zhirmunskyi]MDQ2093197.1 PIN domain-containing protein [Rhodoalgimonas zhirmunskyi]